MPHVNVPVSEFQVRAILQSLQTIGYELGDLEPGQDPLELLGSGSGKQVPGLRLPGTVHLAKRSDGLYVLHLTIQ